MTSKAFPDAALKPPVPYKDKKNILLFAATYRCNADNKSLVTNIHKKINNSHSA